MQAVGARCPGGHLPDKYLVIDIETSGWLGSVNPNGTPACVAQFGFAAVQGREVVHNEAYLIRRPPGTMQAGATGANHITDEMLADGVAPEVFYPKLLKLLELYRSMRCLFVGHNIVGFDRPFVNRDVADNGFEFVIKPDEIIDTGIVYKANKLCVAPRDDETLGHFFQRVSNIRSRVKWNLPLAIQTLHLDKKFGLDLANAHDAGFDCSMTHRLFEELKLLAEWESSGG
jgi:DNA polymerase III epsilon subunit-like protein